MTFKIISEICLSARVHGRATLKSCGRLIMELLYDGAVTLSVCNLRASNQRSQKIQISQKQKEEEGRIDAAAAAAATQSWN
jgi:hypothetical protein